MESGFTQDGVRRWTDNFGDVGCQPSDGRTLRQTRRKARWTAHRNGDHNNFSVKSHGSGIGLVVQHMPSVTIAHPS